MPRLVYKIDLQWLCVTRWVLAQLLHAQEGKYAEVADAARRKTAETLQAEVDRNDAARQNACGASLSAAPPRPMRDIGFETMSWGVDACHLD